LTEPALTRLLTLDEARRPVIEEMRQAKRAEARLLKVIYVA